MALIDKSIGDFPTDLGEIPITIRLSVLIEP